MTQANAIAPVPAPAAATQSAAPRLAACRPIVASTLRSTTSPPASHRSDALGALLARSVAERGTAAAARDVCGVPAEVEQRFTARRLLQRDLVKDHDLTEGKFKLNLKTESHPGAKCGMSGTIKFIPAATAPDAPLIKLYQTVRNEDLTTGKDYVWTGSAAAARLGTQTSAVPSSGIEGGWSIDHEPDPNKVRTSVADPVVSPYYRDYWSNKKDSRDGSKRRNVIKEASLWDYPGWTRRMRWSFETVAHAVKTGHVYGAVTWGFAVTDPTQGKITGERSAGHDTASATAVAALERLNAYYRNPGSPNAPKA